MFRIFLKHLLIKVCNFLVSRGVRRSPSFGTIQKGRRHVCIENPELRLQSDKFFFPHRLEHWESRLRFPDPGCYILVSSASFTNDASQIRELRQSFNSFPMKFQPILRLFNAQKSTYSLPFSFTSPSPSFPVILSMLVLFRPTFALKWPIMMRISLFGALSTTAYSLL